MKDEKMELENDVQTENREEMEKLSMLDMCSWAEAN